MTSWLPESYKAPDFGPSKIVPPQVVAPIPANAEQFYIDLKTLTEILRETGYCKQRFTLAAQKGYKSYQLHPDINSGQLSGINVIVY